MIEVDTSTEIDQLAKALPEAQRAIAKVTRDAANPHFNNRYASLTEIAEAVLPAMNEHGFSVLQPATSIQGAVKVTTILLHISGQWLGATHTVPSSRNDAQGIGSALTYARRQGLQSLLTVAPAGEDDDAESAVGAVKPPLPPQEPQRPTLEVRVAKLETTLREVTSASDLDRAWGLARALRAELRAQDARTADRIDALHERRSGELKPPA